MTLAGSPGAFARARTWVGSRVGLGLFLSRASAALAGFAAAIYLARAVGPVEYGKYATALAVLNFVALFFDLGYFAAGARLLAQAHDDVEKRSYLGAMFVVAGPLSLLLMVIIAGLSFLVDRFFVDRVGYILWVIALTAPAAMAPLLLDQALKASGRVDLVSVWTIVSRALFIVALVVFAALGRLNALSAALAFTGSALVGTLLVVIQLRPKFLGIGPFVARVMAEQRTFGRPLYVGKLANLASYNSDKLLLAHFQAAAVVGYYNLAMSFASSIAMFSQSVAASQFRAFASLRPIPRALLRWNLSGVVLVGVVTLAGVQGIVHWYLGPGYLDSAYLTMPALIATGFQGAYQPYNSWLLANGFGTELRGFLIRNGVVNLVANLILIPTMGAMGAALASAVGMSTYLVQARHQYRLKVATA